MVYLVLRRDLLLVAALTVSIATPACAWEAALPTDEAVAPAADTAGSADEADAPSVAEIEPMVQVTYAVRLRDLEARIEELKDPMRSSPMGPRHARSPANAAIGRSTATAMSLNRLARGHCAACAKTSTKRPPAPIAQLAMSTDALGGTEPSITTRPIGPQLAVS
jgi:hypothetical protein